MKTGVVNNGAKRFWVVTILCYLFIIISLIVPYCQELTEDKVNSSSTPFEFEPYFYETTFSAFEHPSGLITVVIVILTSIVILLTRKKWHKLLLIPLVISYYVIILLSYLGIQSTGWAAVPVGGTILSGFYLLVIGTTALFLIAKSKPIKENIDPECL